MIVTVQKDTFLLKYHATEKTLEESVSFKSEKGNTLIFEKKSSRENKIIILHPDDIVSIKLQTWDNEKKVTGFKKVTFDYLKNHLKDLGYDASTKD